MTPDSVADYLEDLQKRIADALADIDGAPFIADNWQNQLGGGRAMLLENGKIIERGGVNYSRVRGNSLPPSASAHRPEIAGLPFQAMGVSAVIHPRNPYAPTAHLNVRFFFAQKDSAPQKDAPPQEGGGGVWWFGGGMDLTPYYGFKEDCRHFHRACKSALDEFGGDYYPKFKRQCDEYFFLRHRNEPRGIGGIFYDDFCERNFDFSFAFAQSAADAFLKAYPPLLQKRCGTPFGERERQFQLMRRGRYVEFNLIYDRGTLFGLQSGGRTESILMSLPPVVNWRYNWHPEKGSPEEKLYRDFLRPREWAEE